MKGIFLAFCSRAAIHLITLWIVATFCFLLITSVGREAIYGEKIPPPEVKAMIDKKYGFDLPLPQMYVFHMRKMIVLDSVESTKQQGQTLRDILREYLPPSLRLGARALFLAIVLGVPIGALCAVFHNRWVDNGGTLLALTGVSVPNFILASIAIYLLARKMQWLPAVGWDRPSYDLIPFQMGQDFNPLARGVVEEIFRLRLWIPAACLGAFPFAAILRLTRSSMLDALSQDYVRTARAKGVAPWKVIVRHALRNALTPVVTYLGPVTAGILTGSLVIEKVFGIPGIGRFFVESVNNRDMPLILGLTVFYSALLVFMNLLVDAVYPILNPRLRKS